MLRQKIYNIINRDHKGMWAGRVYDWYMLVMIMASIVPLMFIEDYPVFRLIEIVTVSAFIIDYLFRWFTCTLLLKRGWMSYVVYPFTPMAIVDLLSILPGLNLISPEFKLLRLTRLLKIVRLLKIFRYSDKITIFLRVLKKERQVLLSVLMLALFYIFPDGAGDVQRRAAHKSAYGRGDVPLVLRRAVLSHGDTHDRRLRRPLPRDGYRPRGVDAVVALRSGHHSAAVGRHHCELP